MAKNLSLFKGTFKFIFHDLFVTFNIYVKYKKSLLKTFIERMFIVLMKGHKGKRKMYRNGPDEILNFKAK